MRLAVPAAVLVATALLIGSADVALGRSLTQRSWLGPRVGADALANTPIGGPGHYVLAYRFRSTWSGSISALRFYVITNPPGYTEYSGGSLGMFRVSLVADDGNLRLPSRHVLARVDYRPSASQLFPRVRFPSPARVTRGRYYDIVWTNIDPDSARNFASVNSLIAKASGTAPPPPVSAQVLFGNAPDAAKPRNWRARATHTGDTYLPIVDIFGAGGHDLGIGEIESWAENAKPIGGEHAVRELFSFARAQPASVTSALVRVKRTSAGDSPLLVHLESPSGHALGSAQIEASRVPSASPGWVEAHFSRPVRLRHGQKLALVLRAKDVGFEAYPLRDGTHYGFSAATVFSAGYAQYDSGDGWSGWDMWGDSNRHDGDLQFALRLSP